MIRRIMLIAGIMAMSLLSFSQAQRLVILPATMRLVDHGEALASLCLDRHWSAPSGEQYGELGENFQPKYPVPGLGGLPQSDRPLPGRTMFLGAENEDIPAASRRFVTATIERYRTNFTPKKFDQLQDEIWAYREMDRLGLINRNVADQVAEFKAKSKEFAFKYDIQEPTRAETNSAIVGKVADLEDLGFPHTAPDLTGAEFTREGLTYPAAGATRKIKFHYAEGTYYNGVKQPSEIISGARDYYISHGFYPEEANISKSAIPAKYTLVFIAERDYEGPYKMKFLITSVTSHAVEFKFQVKDSKDVCLQ